MTKSEPDDSILMINDVTKSFGGMDAVDHVDLEIKAGEFVTLLGPSGCGKSTLLRMIAGFETPTSGRILMRGRDMSRDPAYQREIGMVFQNLALFPHMNVYDNVAFGLRARNRTEDLDRRVREMIDMVGLSDFEQRRMGQISGGQRQRVALARSLVTEPDVLLLDEPLSALDLKLRRQLQVELKRIQRETGITFIFVTHDQEEALSMSDRIAVMQSGKVVQCGSAVDVYHRPQSEFVAKFVGETNFLRGKVTSDSRGNPVLEPEGTQMRIPLDRADGPKAPGTQVAISIRPENMTLGGTGECAVAARVCDHSFSGATITYALDSDIGKLLARVRFDPGGRHPLPPGESVFVGWSDNAITLIPEPTCTASRGGTTT